MDWRGWRTAAVDQPRRTSAAAPGSFLLLISADRQPPCLNGGLVYLDRLVVDDRSRVYGPAVCPRPSRPTGGCGKTNRQDLNQN